MAGSGRDHSSFKTFQVHDRNPTRSCSGTEDTLARSPRALRKMPASNPFLGGTLTRPARTHRRQTNDEDEVATACSSVAGVELLLLLYILYLYYNIIIVRYHKYTNVFRDVVFMSGFRYAIVFFYYNIYTHFS